MDYSKLPLARRTRLQETVFFRQFNEEKKKKKAVAEKQRASESSAGDDRASTYGDSCAGDSRSTANSVQFQPTVANVGPQEGFGPVRRDNQGLEKNQRARSGKEGNVARADVERMGESSERPAEERKKEVMKVDLKEKRKKTVKSKRREKNVSETDKDDNDDDDDVVFIRMEDCSNARVVGEDQKVGKGAGNSGSDVAVGSKGSKGAVESRGKEKVVETDDDESRGRGKAKVGVGGGVEKGAADFGSDVGSKGSKQSDSEESGNEGSSDDEDYMGSSDYGLEDDGSSSCSDYTNEDDEGVDEDEDEGEDEDEDEDEDDGLGVKEKVSKMGKGGLKRCRRKSPDVVFLRQLGGEGDGEGEGEGDDGVRSKRRREESPEVVYIGQKRGEGFFEEEATTEESRGSGRPIGKKNSSLVEGECEGSIGLLKRKKYSGLDILVGGEEEQGLTEEEPKSVAERLRLRRRRGGKVQLGSFSSPFILTDEDEELESSSSSSIEDEDTDSDDADSDRSVKDLKNVGSSGGKSKGKVERSPGNDAKAMGKSHEKAKGEVGRPVKRRQSAARIPIEKILADSIWQKDDVLVEEFGSSKVPDMEPTLPLKFRFLDEDPITPEKSPSDTEADKLFAEMDFVLAACAIGDSDSSMVDNEDSLTEETESDPATSCHQGKHQLVLDEQIGLICKFCSFVKLEIKHILPSFSKHPLGKADKNYWNSSDDFNFDKLQFQDSVSASNSKDNIGAEGTVWDIIPGIKTTMYAHQQEGLEFIWKNIGGSINLEELKKRACDGGSGCIISHAPGTGKTRLAIVFLQTLLRLYPHCRPVIVAPRSMLLTWEEEFKKWKVDIPFHNLNQPEFSGRENEAALNLVNKAGRRGKNTNSIRLVKLLSWKKGKCVLGISYRLFEKLAEDGIVLANDERCSKTKRKSKQHAEAETVRKMLLELPGLLVFDEGHTPRNDQSLMWRALSGVETQRRILLSGTPFQNNFDELFNTLRLVRPKFCDGVKGDFQRNRGREGRKGRRKWASLTKSIGEDAGNKLNELRAIIDPFVHVYKGMILKENLPGLRDAVVILNPTDLQKSLIGVIEGRNVFRRDHRASLISVHPSLLLGSLLSDEERLAVDINELETLRFDPRAGVKTNFLMELIRLSMAAKEKVLVFSQFIEPLTFIREQLKLSFGWREGQDLLYMDGQIEARHRQSSISLLNDPDSQVQVLLASIRACSEGISLVGASRVVLLDVVWNPSVVRQAISRAYRIGQKKVVYVYHLILSGTMEGEKCVRQAEKYRLSELVFSSADGKLHGEEVISCAVNDDKILQEMVQHEKLSYMFEKIQYQLKESKLIHTIG